MQNNNFNLNSSATVSSSSPSPSPDRFITNPIVYIPPPSNNSDVHNEVNANVITNINLNYKVLSIFFFICLILYGIVRFLVSREKPDENIDSKRKRLGIDLTNDPLPPDFNLQLQKEIVPHREAFSDWLSDKPWQQEKDWKTKYKKYTEPYQLSKGIIQNGSLPLKYIFWRKFKEKVKKT